MIEALAEISQELVNATRRITGIINMVPPRFVSNGNVIKPIPAVMLLIRKGLSNMDKGMPNISPKITRISILQINVLLS